MKEVFVSYRRNDSAAIVGRIIEHLEKTFGMENIFRDIDSIRYGEDFSEVIDRTLQDCQLVLIIIGTEWLNIRGENGTRRLEDPLDWVRIEVSMALELGIEVIPVLVEDASMPTVDCLPNDLQRLARRNAAKVRNDPDFETDIGRLISAIEYILPELTSDLGTQQTLVLKENETFGWKRKILALMRSALICAWIGSTAVSITLAFDFGFIQQWSDLHLIAIYTAYIVFGIGIVTSGFLGLFSHNNSFLPGVLQGWVWPAIAAISQIFALIGLNSLANLLPFLSGLETLALFILCGSIFPTALTFSATITRKLLLHAQ